MYVRRGFQPAKNAALATSKCIQYSESFAEPTVHCRSYAKSLEAGFLLQQENTKWLIVDYDDRVGASDDDDDNDDVDMMMMMWWDDDDDDDCLVMKQEMLPVVTMNGDNDDSDNIWRLSGAQDEVMARLAAERRLQEAEQRLRHLEQGIQDHGSAGKGLKEEKRKEMIGDVTAIRSKAHHAVAVQLIVLNNLLH